MEHHEYCQRSPIASITLTLPNQEYLKISIIKYRIINVSHFLFFLVYLRNLKKNEDRKLGDASKGQWHRRFEDPYSKQTHRCNNQRQQCLRHTSGIIHHAWLAADRVDNQPLTTHVIQTLINDLSPIQSTDWCI